MIAHIVINVRQWHSRSDIYATLVFLLECDIGRLLVDSDPEPFQFIFNHSLVRQWLVDIEDDEDQVAGLRDGNDLASTAFAIFSTLDNTGKIKNLYLRAIVQNLARNGCELDHASAVVRLRLREKKGTRNIRL